jgi:hypothetical protein
VPVIALTKITARRLPEGGRDRANLGTVLHAAERGRDLVKQRRRSRSKRSISPRSPANR